MPRHIRRPESRGVKLLPPQRAARSFSTEGRSNSPRLDAHQGLPRPLVRYWGMSTATLSLPRPVPPPRPGAARPVSVFLPKEHGSWSLALEPLALGLLIAPSWAGGALAGAVLAGFFVRRPLKAAFTADLQRRREARGGLALLGMLALAGLFEAGVLGGWSAL